MNNLQKLIKLRGLTVTELAERIGHGYHMTQKVIKGVKYKRRDGSTATYCQPEIQQAVAAQLGLTREQVWGPKSHLVLRRLIKKEIMDQARRQAQNMKKQFLHSDRIAEKKAAGNV